MFNLLSSLDINSDSRFHFFKINRSLLRKPTPVNPLIFTDGTLRYDAAQKAETFVESIDKQFEVPVSSQPLDDYIYETVHHHNNSTNHPKLIFFTPGKLLNTILQIKNKSAPGPDFISNIALKYCSNLVILHLRRIFNGCVRLEYFPYSWK